MLHCGSVQTKDTRRLGGRTAAWSGVRREVRYAISSVCAARTAPWSSTLLAVVACRTNTRSMYAERTSAYALHCTVYQRQPAGLEGAGKKRQVCPYTESPASTRLLVIEVPSPGAWTSAAHPHAAPCILMLPIAKAVQCTAFSSSTPLFLSKLIFLSEKMLGCVWVVASVAAPPTVHHDAVYAVNFTKSAAVYAQGLYCTGERRI